MVSGDPPTSDDDRGLVTIVRFLLAVIFLALVVVGGALVAPHVLDDVTIDDPTSPLEDPTSPIQFEEPPPAGDRDPDQVDPADPNESSYEANAGTVESEPVEDFVHAKVNERRAEHDLEPLEWDGTVASVSRAHSQDLHERDYFDHTNPDDEGPLDRFSEVGSYCQAYGENIAMTWVDRDVQSDSNDEVDRHETPEQLAEGLVEQWMNSPPHREAMLSDSWDRGGVGVYLTDDGQVFATHNFCGTG